MSLRKSPTFAPTLLDSPRRNARIAIGRACIGSSEKIFFDIQSRNVTENRGSKMAISSAPDELQKRKTYVDQA